MALTLLNSSIQSDAVNGLNFQSSTEPNTALCLTFRNGNISFIPTQGTITLGESTGTADSDQLWITNYPTGGAYDTFIPICSNVVGVGGQAQFQCFSPFADTPQTDRYFTWTIGNGQTSATSGLNYNYNLSDGVAGAQQTRWQVGGLNAMAQDGPNAAWLIGKTTFDSYIQDSTRPRVQVRGISAAYAAGRLYFNGSLGGTYANLWWMGWQIDNQNDINAAAVVCNFNSAAIAATSDHRRKHDIQPITDPWNQIMSLRPIEFSWIDDDLDNIEHGFLAHEFQQVFPNAVTNSRDAVDDSGNPRYQMLDTRVVIPALAAAIRDMIQDLDAMKQHLDNQKAV